MPKEPQSQTNAQPLKSNANPYGEKPDAVPGTAKPGFENEGEGSRSAARRYNEGVEKTVRSGHVERAAKDAEEALEGPEGDELREAENEAKSVEPEPTKH